MVLPRDASRARAFTPAERAAIAAMDSADEQSRPAMNIAHDVFCAALVLVAANASAQVDPFEFEVYPYQTVGNGMVELESLNSFVPNGHNHGDDGTSAGTFPSQDMYRTAFELTYGLTDHIEAAAYLNLAKPDADSFQYAGSKFRVRGSLFEQGELPVDFGWYLELEWHKTPQFDDNELELELKTDYREGLRTFEIDLNPIFEKAIFVGPDKNKGFEFGYAAGIYYDYLREISPGLEFYGALGLIDNNDPLHAQQHYIFPVLKGDLPRGIEYNVGPGIGLTRGSDHVIMKFNLELEHFVGSLFPGFACECVGGADQLRVMLAFEASCSASSTITSFARGHTRWSSYRPRDRRLKIKTPIDHDSRNVGEGTGAAKQNAIFKPRIVVDVVRHDARERDRKIRDR